ncbi:predicted protein [Histoplasma mississippiense (nom. inval.)]|uniref:predicted protein n=1 Tax=Ajellomyces capsulatus (strain NAm1 / WU24) TaxID=2059318 RepID=UPI000157C3E5|nr:predicted protein [Histoplasma mississippiense (nom. inval.)]EDN07523.1 predicted protein [Histoplasma mississippiense (nom. inval.)]
MSNPSKERINPLDPNPLDEPINPLEVEHAGPKPVGRQTRPRSPLTRWELNTLDPTRWTSNPSRSALTRWESNTLDPNPLDVKPVPGAH